MEQPLMRLLLQEALRKVLQEKDTKDSTSGELFVQWLRGMIEDQESKATIIEQDGYFVSEAAKTDFDDPDLYVPIRWLEMYVEDHKVTKGLKPALCIYPDIEQYQPLRSEILTEISTKAYHFIVNWEPVDLHRTDWMDNEQCRQLRYPLKEGKQETHPLTDTTKIEALANAYRKLSDKHYLLFVCAVAYGIPVNQLITYNKGDLILEVALANRRNELSELFPAELLIQIINATTKENDDAVFSLSNRHGDVKMISRIKAFKWLAQGLKDVKGVEQVSATTLEKTYEYFKNHQSSDGKESKSQVEM